MQHHTIWHEGTLGKPVKTDFYSEKNAEVIDGVMFFHNKTTNKGLTIPLSKILWIESEYVGE